MFDERTLIEPNISTVDSNLILKNTDFLPLMKLVSINNDPEYIDLVVETNGGRKRKIQNKRKKEQLNRNIISSGWKLKCNHTKMIKLNVC